ncbi:hypothetical protein APHAL10511_003712 [Amanita phalloides]|nr:hypothetical protein APHAL10511_003712 [Amanita phalloides]
MMLDIEQDLHHEDSGTTKKRRLNGACDMCRKKKIRCDSAAMPDNRCSNCITFGFNCEHTPHRTKAQEREDQKDSYIRDLEGRLHKLEQALRSYDYPQPESLPGSLNSADEISKYPNPHIPSINPLAHSSPSTSADLESETSDAGNSVTVDLDNQFRNLVINPEDRRFFGKSSPFTLIRHAAVVKKEMTGTESELISSSLRRRQYWEVQPWERAYCEAGAHPSFTFPDPDLLFQLIDIYFNRVNLLLPLLHRPTFEQLVRDGYHTRDGAFGACVMVVCAIASRYSDDNRVLLEEELHKGTRLSSGWKYFVQVPAARNYLLERLNLYDLYFYCLSAVYLVGSSIPYAAWYMIGICVRIALDHGLHKRKRNGGKSTVEEELYRRAFWVIIGLDRTVCSISGRPIGLHEEDIDTDLPVECDDEYWEIDANSHITFNQPTGRPSHMAAFLAFLRLTDILAHTMRTLYSTGLNRPSSDEWEQRIVTDIDSAMNEWKQQLPSHLEWDPLCKDELMFHQSAGLHSVYYQLQMQVHRPFIHKKSPLSVSSNVICTNAARSSIRIAEAQVKRNAPLFPQNSMTSFIAGIMLLLNLWVGKRAGVSIAPEKAMAEIDRCLFVLKLSENRSQMAGRLWDILHELATTRNQFVPSTSISKKRPRQSQPSVVPHAVEAALPVVEISPFSDTNYGNMQEMAAFASPGTYFNSDLKHNVENIVPTAVDELVMGDESIWSNIPLHFNMNDWETFVSSMNELDQMVLY